MTTASTYWDFIKARRSLHVLGKDVAIPDEHIVELINETVLNAPSAFNSQTSRLVVLFKEDHDRFWDLTLETQRAKLPPEAFAHSASRLPMFRAAYATILFFEDTEVVEAMKIKSPGIKDDIPKWSQHTSAIHQFILWTGLEAEGLGANLQHYNNITSETRALWNIPETWELTAQLVFGSRAGAPRVKEFKPLEERVFIHGLAK